MTDRTRIAVIGLGMALKPHVKSLADLSDRVEVAGAYSRSPERCRDVGKQTGYAMTTELDRLVDDRSIDAALILTPPATHFEIASRFLDAGKDVLVEKPLEVSLSQAERLVEHARTCGRRLGVVHQHRFRESSRTLRKAIDSGVLGSIAAATCHVPWWRPQSYYDEPGRGTFARDGGGVLMTQAIHTLDLFRALVGGIERVAAISATTGLHRMETEDFVGAALSLRGGLPGTLSATTASYPGFSEEIVLIGEHATAKLTGGSLTLHHHDGRTEETSDGKATGGGSDPMDFPHDAHRELLRDFLDARDAGRDPTVDGLEALRTNDLIETLLDSARQRQWMEVPLR